MDATNNEFTYSAEATKIISFQREKLFIKTKNIQIYIHRYASGLSSPNIYWLRVNICLNRMFYSVKNVLYGT